MNISSTTSTARAASPVQGDVRLPLCVDLDGTLIHADSLHEALMVATRDVRAMARATAQLGKGKAVFKRAIYEIAALEAATLAYNEELVAYLHEQKGLGRRIFLVTAADHLIADAVAEHVGVFEGVLASDGARNLRGSAKADVLVEKFGAQGFCYAGNDATDLRVWQVAGGGVLVNTPSGVAAKARKLVDVEAEFAPRKAQIKAVIKALRPHQWAKNVLVFLPIVVSTEFFDIAGWQRAAMLFVAFCFAASSIYIVNDLVDLNADRRHPRKRLRPFASGLVSVKTGLVVSGLLALLAVAVAAPVGGVVLVVGYAALSSSYSFILKEKALVDVFILASLYTIRMYAGGEVSGHAVTEWLVGFSIFMFLSLALAKRVAELLGTRSRGGGSGKLSRRAYTDQDVTILQTMGVASAFLAALVLSLYLQSQAAHSLYLHPAWLLAVAVAVLFWLSRVWMQTARGEMHDDPVVWAVKDRTSQVLGVVAFLAMMAAIGKI